MLVSKSRKLVFVHIQKTGGSTVSTLLREKIPDLYQVGLRHQLAIQVMNEVEGWDKYYKFAFVRNPWDRLVSWYSMIINFEALGIRTHNALQRYVCDNSSSFTEFIYRCTDEVDMKGGICYSFAYDQLDYVTDENGHLLVDFIGKVENFERDMHRVLSSIGVELEPIPKKNRSPHRHYSTYYTRETEMLVRERFKRDIEYFGYEFERPQTVGHTQLETADRAVRPDIS